MTTMYKIASTSNANTLMRNPTLYVQNDTSTIRIVDVKKRICQQKSYNINIVFLLTLQ